MTKSKNRKSASANKKRTDHKLANRKNRLKSIILRQVIIFGSIFIVSIISLEITFRIYLFLARKDVIKVLPKKEVFEKAWFAPHPYLIYVFKPDSTFRMNKFARGLFTINHYGFRSTLEFDVKNTVKPPGTLRIATLGGSTTMGVNDDNLIWPYLTGKYLKERNNNLNIEVLNEGIMGYTSLENLLDLSMRVIDYDSDIYILYLGVNDIFAEAPVDIYRTDYAHFRRTLYENLDGAYLPGWLLQSKIISGFLQMSGVRDSRDLINNTTTGKFQVNYEVPQNQQAIVELALRRTIMRNVKSMVGVIRAHKPNAMIILSSFVDFRRLRVMFGMNSDFEKYAHKAGLVFVDAANRIPQDGSTYDYGHFTPKGDRMMAELFAEAIANNIRQK